MVTGARVLTKLQREDIDSSYIANNWEPFPVGTMSQSQCVLQCGELIDDRNDCFKISQERWDKLKSQSQSWRGLDKFGDVYDTVDWEI